MDQYKRFFPGIYIFSYAAIGALFPLIAQYLGSIGFSGTKIGIITSSSTAIGILSNSFWGSVYHKNHRSKFLIMILCIMTALLSLFLMALGGFGFFLLLYVAVFFFENPIYPLIDSTVMEAKYPFGAARKWGAIGFALGIGIAGFIAEHFGLISIFPMFAGFFLLTAILLWSFIKIQKGMPETKDTLELRLSVGPMETKRQDEQGGSYKELLTNRKYIALLASAFFFNGPALAHNTYFSFLYIGVGGSISGMGLVLLLMVISEAPVMAFSERISGIFTMEKAILLAMMISTIRFFWYSTSPPHELIFATFFLQGITNGIVLVEVVKYISKVVGPSMLSLAIPLQTAISSNCGTIICQFLGGIIVERFGGHGVYFFYGALNFLGILIYVISGLYSRDTL